MIKLFSMVSIALALPCIAQEPDFLPIEPGNRWIYVHEQIDGSFIGDYRIDTCAVEVTPESFERRDGETYFDFGLIGYPCWTGTTSDGDTFPLRKDAAGNILRRPTNTLELPDTSGFLAAHPGWTSDQFLGYLPHVLRDGYLMFYDFGSPPADESPLTVFNNWYRGQYLMRMIEASATRGETVGSPPPLVSGAERVGFSENSFEDGRYIIFESGIGVTYVDLWNHWGSASYEETIRLLWARIGGTEYGRKPTVTLPTSWASVKTRQ